MEQFWHACIPLMVAFDGIGLVPLYWGLAQHLNQAQRMRAITEAVATAIGVALGFLFIARFLFSLMGLRIADVMVAGGLILLVLCLKELVLPELAPEGRYPSPGMVPLGVPLLAGPAVLTTVLLVRDQYGWPVTVCSLVANLVLVWVILRAAEWMMRRLGHEGAQVISRISSLVLTAFGVMLIRRGLMMFLHGQ